MVWHKKKFPSVPIEGVQHAGLQHAMQIKKTLKNMMHRIYYKNAGYVAF